MFKRGDRGCGGHNGWRPKRINGNDANLLSLLDIPFVVCFAWLGFEISFAQPVQLMAGGCVMMITNRNIYNNVSRDEPFSSSDNILRSLLKHPTQSAAPAQHGFSSDKHSTR